MSSLRAISLVALAAAVLAACSKPAGSGTAASGGAPASSAAASAGQGAGPGQEVVIDASQAPRPRAGEWEMTDTSDGGKRTDRFCQADRPFNVGKDKQYCQKYVFHRTLGGGLAIDSECSHGGAVSKVHMVANGDFQSAYSTDMQMSIALRPGQPPQQITSHMDYRYVGPCNPSEQAAAEQAAKGD